MILTGGFGQSPSLQSFLRRALARRQITKHPIDLVVPKISYVKGYVLRRLAQEPTDETISSTAVACGAVLRALRKEDGPSRLMQCGYGFLTDEPWDDDSHEAHKGIKPYHDILNNKYYVKETLDWIFTKVRHRRD